MTEHKKTFPQIIRSFIRDFREDVEYYGIIHALTPQWLNRAKLFLLDHLWYRYNVLKIKSLTAHYADRDNVLLHANFQVLTDFVEKELIPCEQHELFDLVKEERQLREYYGQGIDIDKENAEKFIQQSLDSLKRQNESTQEILDLYHWWKNREKRTWPEYCYFGTSGKGIGELNKYGEYDLYEMSDSEGTEEEKIKYKTHRDEWGKVDDAYEKEDDDMLNRLIKIRRHLWT